MSEGLTPKSGPHQFQALTFGGAEPFRPIEGVFQKSLS
jgi:hypothetical protein